jgi:ADP-heptose:LPS heptosyltransferase
LILEKRRLSLTACAPRILTWQLQMQGGGYNSNPFVRRLGARVTAGGRESKAIALDRWVPYHYHQQEVIRQLEIVSLVGAQTPNIHPRLAVLDRDVHAAAQYVGSIPGPFVVLHSGARDIRRCWRPERFARLGDRIRRELGLQVVLTGTGDVADDTADIVEDLMEEKAVNLSGKLSLEALVGLLSQAAGMVSNDTGPMHTGIGAGRADDGAVLGGVYY